MQMFLDVILKAIRDAIYIFEGLNFLPEPHYSKKFEICFVQNMNILAILRIVKISLYTKTRRILKTKTCFITKACFLTIIVISDDSDRGMYLQ
jgi:hypothetical protein